MSRFGRKAQGVTLLEAMLVIGIAASFMLLSVRSYQVLKLQSDETELRYNIDQVFIAAAKYYQASCRPQVDAITGAVIAGTGEMAPSAAASYNPPNPFPVSMATLVQGGYLDTTLPRNPIIDNSGANKGYEIQYNQSTPVPKKTMITSTAPLVTKDIGNIIMWRIQVAVKMKNAAMARTYKNILGADCVSQFVGTGVRTCQAAQPGGNYLVWERLPSFASPDADPQNMTTNASIKQFNQLYQVMPEQYSVSVPVNDKQNFLCGS